MILYLFLLALCVFFDSGFSFSFFDFLFKLQLSSLLLFYFAFRKGSLFLFYMILFFALLTHVFTITPFTVVLLSHLAVFFVIYHLRKGMFAESYLTHAFWVFVFSLLLQVVMFVSAISFENLTDYSLVALKVILQSCMISVLSLPVFIFLDKLDYFLERLTFRFQK